MGFWESSVLGGVMRIAKYASFLLVVLLVASCATVFKGATDPVKFGSNPVGVEVFVDGKLMGKTPLNLELTSKKTYVIDFKFEGQTKTVNLTNKVGVGWVVLDVLFGLVPIIVDAATGSWYMLTPKNLNVDFTSPGRFVPSPEPL
jgi:CRISPR/Cas system-associated exonuclease Cas4 (RecB family)